MYTFQTVKTDFKKHFLELEIAKTLFIIEVSVSCSSFIIRKYNFFFLSLSKFKKLDYNGALASIKKIVNEKRRYNI